VKLDEAICERARLARDARFDGRFFIGVVSTGIYCRPICPAPTVKRQNIRYFLSAAAAAEAGLRPCLRCRPEVAPGSPAWIGSSVTVGRALRLVGEGALDDGSMEDLSQRLGVSPRHLHRLFVQHLGASPAAVARTRRLDFAKQLLTDTHLPMAQVALSSGFQSVRRFNDTFRTLYGRTPSELRRLRPSQVEGADGPYVFRLAYRPPFDWESHLAFLAARSTPGVEEVRGLTYRRTFTLHGRQGILEVRPMKPAHALEARVRFPEPSGLLQIVARLRAMFDLSADPAVVARHFRSDPLLGPLVKKYRGLRIPGAWDAFELAVRAILGQQVTVRGATLLAGRLAQRFGSSLMAADHGSLTHAFPPPEALAEADLTGLPRVRAEAIRALSRAVSAGVIPLRGAATGEALVDGLTSIRGIGDWTAQYVAMRAFNEPDAFPAGDLVLRCAAGGGRELTPAALAKRAEAWRPWRAYAAMYLWRHAADGHRQRARSGGAGVHPLPRVAGARRPAAADPLSRPDALL
jgi:AraC family transcriptional regulator of adaptative response / DNA-3-methyladenine glycosylase II